MRFRFVARMIVCSISGPSAKIPHLCQGRLQETFPEFLLTVPLSPNHVRA
jgi:hypothetical protein